MYAEDMVTWTAAKNRNHNMFNQLQDKMNTALEKLWRNINDMKINSRPMPQS